MANSDNRFSFAEVTLLVKNTFIYHRFITSAMDEGAYYVLSRTTLTKFWQVGIIKLFGVITLLAMVIAALIMFGDDRESRMFVLAGFLLASFVLKYLLGIPFMYLLIWLGIIKKNPAHSPTKSSSIEMG